MKTIIKAFDGKIILFFFMFLFSNIIAYADENIIINKPYKIKFWPYHLFIEEKEKCYDGEELHEVMIALWEGIIIFGEKNIILSQTFRAPKNGTEYTLTIIDENKNLIIDNNIVGTNCEINVIGYNIIIQYYCDGELRKEIMEIEDVFK